MTLKIEEGKYYRTRNGEKEGPMRPNMGGEYAHTHPWRGRYKTYRTDGGYVGREYGICDDDLVAEWTDEPETGTLAELDAKPGDVVEYLGGGKDDMWWSYPDVGDAKVIGADGSWFGVDAMFLHELTGKFRIVSRAPTPDEPKKMEDTTDPAPDKSKLLRDMTDAEIGALVRAWRDGRTIEFWEPDHLEWRDCSNAPIWTMGVAYRVQPERQPEQVTLYSADACAWSSLHATNAKWALTYDLSADGEPDLTSIRMEKL